MSMESKPTIVLIPGLLCDAHAWGDTPARLERFGTVFVADLSTQDDLRAMAGDILAAHAGPLAVAGHSMGARVALEMVRQAPDRIVRLALLDTGYQPRRDGEEVRRQELVDLAHREGMAALASVWLPPMVHPDRHADATLMGGLAEMVGRMTPDLHERQIRALVGRPDAEPLLPRIACPTLLVVGRQDAWSPLAQHEAMKALIPGSRLVVIENAGHFAPVERPAEVADALATFFEIDRERSSPMTSRDLPSRADGDRIPVTPLMDRRRNIAGYNMNKMAMGLMDPANRAAFRDDEDGYLDRFGLTPDEKAAVKARNWEEMVRLGGNLFFILKISAVDPVAITRIGAAQAGMDHTDFLTNRLGKKLNG